MRRQAEYLESAKLRRLADQRDIKAQIENLRDENNKIKRDLDEIDKRIILKKRYVMVQHQKQERLHIK